MFLQLLNSVLEYLVASMALLFEIYTFAQQVCTKHRNTYMYKYMTMIQQAFLAFIREI